MLGRGITFPIQTPAVWQVAFLHPWKKTTYCILGMPHLLEYMYNTDQEHLQPVSQPGSGSNLLEFVFHLGECTYCTFKVMPPPAPPPLLQRGVSADAVRWGGGGEILKR